MGMKMREVTPWIDEKYARLVEQRVEKYRVVSENPLLVNFRCPVCGDSKKNKNKARGFLYRNKSGGISYKCHNCGDGRSMGNLLKFVDERMYSEYRLESMRGTAEGWTKREYEAARTDAVAAEERTRMTPPGGAVRVSDLNQDHPARKYWKSRMIPPAKMKDVYWVDAYYTWVNGSVIPGKFTEAATRRDCGRLVFPFRDVGGVITGYTGRSIGGEEPRYVAIKSANSTAIFGTDTVDRSRTVYVVEGPIDSLFLDNAVAMGTSSRAVEFPDYVMVYDNEPRNPDIVRIMKKSVDSGDRVVVWPESVTQKDINDMVLAGVDAKSVISQNTHRGIRAKLAIERWCKC